MFPNLLATLPPLFIKLILYFGLLRAKADNPLSNQSVHLSIATASAWWMVGLLTYLTAALPHTPHNTLSDNPEAV